MKPITKTLSVLFICIVVSSFVRAQESAVSVQPQPAATDFETLLQVLEATKPFPATATPKSGTFYTVQNGENWPPLPGNLMDLPFWDLGDGFYLLDDRDINYVELRAEAAAKEEISGGEASRMSMSMNNNAWGSVYLTNLVTTFSSNQIASFDIAGGINYVPYDIWRTTDLSNQISQLQWTWLGIGYTSNHYAFTNQPSDLAFYALSKPLKTMAVGWGNDTVAQCSVPFGLTNIIAVAGGGGQSVALFKNGTMTAWGQNTYGQGSVPTNLAGVTMIAAGWYHNVALLTNGTLMAWGLNAPSLGWNLTNVPPDLTNVTVISAQALHSLALRNDGTVVAWGYNGAGETNVPSGLSNVVAIAAGLQHNLAVKADGTAAAWGNNNSGQCDIPSGLSNVVDVAAGSYHSLALLNNGTVVAWGDNSSGETNVPVGLTNVVAIAAAGDPYNGSAYSLALKSDGTIAVWGDSEVVAPLSGLDNVIAIGAGADHALAVRSGPPTPVVTLQPENQYQLAGNSVTFTTQGRGLAAIQYQWQFDAVNISDATNSTLTLTNVQTAQEGNYRVIVSDTNGSIASSNAVFSVVTQPIILSQSLPTNPVAIFYTSLTLTVNASAPGQFGGFPLSYQWQFNGTNLSGANASSYTMFVTSPGTYSVIVSNAAGSVSATWSVTMTYVGSYIDVGTLAYHLSTNAVGRTNGYAGNASGQTQLANWTNADPAIYSGTNLALLTNAVWSTNFWLKGAQGLSATCIGYSNGVGGQFLVTMVSPRHYMIAQHVGAGPPIFFLDTNNVVYPRTSLQRVDVVGDTSVGILDADLPSSVGFLAVVPTNLSAFLPTNNSSIVQGIGMNQHMRLFSQPMTFSQTSVGWDIRNAVPFGLRTNWNVGLRVGDSSNPVRLLIGNRLVLVSHNSGVNGGGNYASQFTAINQKMHYLSTNNNVGTDYQLTPFSLTNWPAIP